MTSSAKRLDDAIIRIFGTNGVPIGAAFLVADRIAVTCAHVAGRAAREGEVDVDFPLLAPGTVLRARVDEPPAPGHPDDIAWLLLPGPPPPGARPVALDGAEVPGRRPVTVFGFPAAHDDGVRAFGRLAGTQATGWIQVDAAHGHGHFVEPGFSGGPAWDEERAVAVGMVVATGPPDLRTAYVIPAALLLASRPDLLAATEPPCPYRGLRPFTESDEALFHGRDEVAADLARELRSRHLLVITGASGSGKSSLALAGLVPRLRASPGLVVAVFRPGGDAILSLAAALLPLLEPGLGEVERLARLVQLAEVIGKGHLSQVTERVLAVQDAGRLLIVADQLEEVFTEGDTGQGRLIADALLPLPPDVWLLATLRADFIDHVSRVQNLAHAFHDSLRIISPMERPALASTITAPLPPGVTVEPGLAERILDDLGDAPGRLPLLQFTLTCLWEHRDHGRLTHDAYDRLGAVGGSLATYAEQIWTERLTSHADTPDSPARLLFSQLVRPGENTASTRRIARRTDLGDERWALARRLADDRLLVTGRDPDGAETVELAHEALITHWTRLRDWAEQDRDFRTWQDGFQHDLTRWERAGHPRGGLLYGPALKEARRWRSLRPAALSTRETGYIARSLRHRRRAPLVRSGVTLVVAALIGGLTLLGIDLTGHDRPGAADRLMKLSVAGRTGYATALLYGIAAYRTDPADPEIGAALFSDYFRTALADRVYAVPRDAGSIARLVASDDGAVIAVGTGLGRAFLWRRAVSPDPVDVLPGRQVDAVAVSPDGTTLVAGGRDSLWFVDVDTLAVRTVRAATPGRRVSAVRIQHGLVAASLTGEYADRVPGAVEVYSPRGDLERVLPVRGQKGYLTVIGVTPGARAAIVKFGPPPGEDPGFTDVVRIGLADTGTPGWRTLARAVGTDLRVEAAGDRLFFCAPTAGADGGLRLFESTLPFRERRPSALPAADCYSPFRLDSAARWFLDLDGWAMNRWTATELAGPPSRRREWSGVPRSGSTIGDMVAASAGDRPLVVSADDQLVLVTSSRDRPLPYRPGTVDVALRSPGGGHYVTCGPGGVVTAYADGGARTGRVRIKDGVCRPPGSGSGTGAVELLFSPDGRWLAVAGEFRTAVYRMPGLTRAGSLPGVPGVVDPDSERLALPVALVDRTHLLVRRDQRLLMSSPGREATPFFDPSVTGFGGPGALKASADGTLVAVGDTTGKRIEVWDTRTRARRGSIVFPHDTFTDLALSPDGRLLVVCDDRYRVHLYTVTAGEPRSTAVLQFLPGLSTEETGIGWAGDIRFLDSGRRVLIRHGHPAVNAGLAHVILDRTGGTWHASPPLAGPTTDELIATSHPGTPGVDPWREYTLSTRPSEWTDHLCTILSRRELTPAERRDLPEDAQATGLCSTR
ncbi:nSTAND1 domain-containing NTPase [Sphaerisporangium aureirubrum]|uniref:Trypsin-like peptidase domain-containing protein n=1 Tax=Sphaerisporangium aureirubrum TaxID=1544736 RepID=A0ABW1NNS6_9ACTN